MRKMHKRYSRPRALFSKVRMEEENALVKQYGLKNKKEIWKAVAALARIREQAKRLILEPEAQKIFLEKLVNLGLLKGKASLDDALSLTKVHLLERRLQTIVFKKGLAKTVGESRQIIAHRKIVIADRIITVPGRMLTVNEEAALRRLGK
jgi:small subunit ribosomal protein S4